MLSLLLCLYIFNDRIGFNIISDIEDDIIPLSPLFKFVINWLFLSFREIFFKIIICSKPNKTISKLH